MSVENPADSRFRWCDACKRETRLVRSIEPMPWNADRRLVRCAECQKVVGARGLYRLVEYDEKRFGDWHGPSWDPDRLPLPAPPDMLWWKR